MVCRGVVLSYCVVACWRGVYGSIGSSSSVSWSAGVGTAAARLCVVECWSRDSSSSSYGGFKSSMSSRQQRAAGAATTRTAGMCSCNS
jgi:hypothetical protein